MNSVVDLHTISTPIKVFWVANLKLKPGKFQPGEIFWATTDGNQPEINNPNPVEVSNTTCEAL